MIRLEEVVKTYDLGTAKLQALNGLSLEIQKKDFVTIMGPSGSGKSTLLHILGMLDTPNSGLYYLEEARVDHLPDSEKARIRNQHFGFVFQSFNLLPEFSALENVIMPLMYGKMSRKERKERAIELLDSVQMGHRLGHFPAMLSGGEQQRVAIARALANSPDLILADEPTGNLPRKIGDEIISLLQSLNDQGVTVVMVTHDDLLGHCGTRELELQDGKLIADHPVVERYLPEAARLKSQALSAGSTL